MELIPGGNAPVPSSLLHFKINCGLAADISSFRLYNNEKTRCDADMVFYGQTKNDDGSIKMLTEEVNTIFVVNLSDMHNEVKKIAFTVTDSTGNTISNLRMISFSIEAEKKVLVTGKIDTFGRSEAALIVGEFYRRNAEWKFRMIDQGFNGGLKPLAEHYGVEINNDIQPQGSPAPKPISLSKVSLTKEKPKVNLSKQDDFGLIKVNLNWNRTNSSKPIDLDLGVFVRLHDDYIAVVQALGRAFGSLNNTPYIELQGDDRTGSVSDGEWLHINGSCWKLIKEILIFSFIYDGIPSWDNTDGIVTLYVPGQPPIESRLTEGDKRYRMCAIAKLVNQKGEIEIERVNKYYLGHKEMDNAFNWGFRWTIGSK